MVFNYKKHIRYKRSWKSTEPNKFFKDERYRT